MATYKLKSKYIITGKIIAVTGLAIGGSNSVMGIGGVDKAVIRNPINNQPFIPGSSLKGKMRSLFELNMGEIGEKPMGAVRNGPSEKEGSRSANLFGSANNTDFEDRGRKGGYQHASRIIVRDANLSKRQAGDKSIADFFASTDLPYTEVKTEVVIDRITSKAMPRQMERVPAGATFEFEMVMNVFADDNESQLLSDLFAAIRLLQNDYLGGSGTRGSGQIRFSNFQIKKRTDQYYLTGNDSEDQLITETYIAQFPKNESH